MAAFDGNAYRKDVLKPLLDRPGADFDAFEVFALDPATDDQAEIEQRITAVVAFWRREQGSARYRSLVSQLLDRRAELTAVLADPQRRAALRARAHGASTQAQAERGARLDAMIDRLASNFPAGIPRSRIERLRASVARDGVTDAEFTAHTASLTIVEDEAEPYPTALRKQLRATLAEYHRLTHDGSGPGAPPRSLYGFVGVDASAADQLIVARHAELAARNRQRRHDRLRTVTDELLTLTTAYVIEGDRRRYRASMIADVKDRLRPEIDAVLVLEDRVDAIEYERLVRLAVAEGLDAPTARSTVTAVAVELGGAVETGAAVEYVTCPACGAVEAVGARRSCRRCATALYRSCPACGSEIDAAAHVCEHCGTDLAALVEAERERQARLTEVLALEGPAREAQLVELVGHDPGFDEAKRVLTEIAVAPARRVAAFVGDREVKVGWRPWTAPGPVTYRVVRVTGGAEYPVGTTTTCEMADHDAVTGSHVSYRVFAERLGVASAPAKTGEVLVARDPDHVRVDNGDGQVRLTWDPPPAGTVWLDRTAAATPRHDVSGEPTRRTPAGASGEFVDTDVVNGTTYEYRLYVEYPVPGATPYRTHGRTVTARPYVRPKPVESLAVVTEGDLVRLSWPAPPSGRVQIVRTPDRPALAAGTVISPRHLPRYGTLLGPEGTDRLDGSMRWYAAVTVTGDEGIVGARVGHPGFAAIHDVTAADEGPDVVVRWSWPAGCTEVLVVWDGPGGPGETKVTNMKYELGDGFRIGPSRRPGPPDQGSAPPGRYEITVAPGARSKDGEIVWAVPGEALAHDRPSR